MSDTRDTFVSEIYVNDEQAKDAMAELTSEVNRTAKAYEKLLNTKNADAAKTEKARKAWESATQSLANARKGTELYATAMKELAGKSMQNLLWMQRQINSELKKTKPNTEEWRRLSEQYGQVTERINSLKKAQSEVMSGMGKLRQWASNATQWFNKWGTAIMAVPLAFRKVVGALKGVIDVTKQVINASQTMGDKWNNGMAAMKTTTEAFFMALSSGDWTAFENGIDGALKKARELAELKDLLGDYKISEGVMQAEYLTKYNQARTTALDTEASPREREQAVQDMMKNMEAYSNFVEAEGKATWETLQASFDAWKGLQFETGEEMHKFLVRYFEFATVGRDEEVASLLKVEKAYKQAYSTYTNMSGMLGNENEAVKKAKKELDELEAAYTEASKTASKETKAIIAALELPDDKKTALSEMFQSYMASMDKVNQMRQTANRTRDRVTKQIAKETGAINEQSTSIEVVMADIAAWETQEKHSAYERFLANRESFADTAEAYRQYQNEMAGIDADAAAKRKKAQEEETKRLEAEAEKRKQAAEKAYQNAQNKIAKAEAAQLNTLKQLYAAGLMDKQNYEAQKAVIEEDFLKQKMATAEKYGKDTDQFMSQLLDRQIARMDKAKAMLKEEMEEMAKYYAHERGEDEQKTVRRESEEPTPEELKRQFQEKLWAKAADIRAAITEDSARTEYETEVMWAQKLAEQKKITAEEAERYILQAKLKYAQAAAQQVSQITEQASNFVNALKEYETQKAEAEYQAQLTAAGDNAEQREAVEAAYEQKKLDIQKKYADTEMVINIAKTVAAGALAAIQAFAQLGPIGGAIAAALIAVTTAMEVATIVQQRNAIKNASVGGGGSSSVKTGTRTVTGYSEGGETPWAPSDDTPVGVVHANEYVIPAWMKRQEPVLIANLERYRKSGSRGRKGSASQGFVDGGDTGMPVASGRRAKRHGGDFHAYVKATVMDLFETGAIRIVLVRKDLSELDEQDERFKNQTSRWNS